MKLPSNLTCSSCPCRAASVEHGAEGVCNRQQAPNHQSTFLLHWHCWAPHCYSHSHEPSAPNWMHMSSHFAQCPSVRVCAEGLVGITAPPASIPVGRAYSWEGTLKLGPGQMKNRRKTVSPLPFTLCCLKYKIQGTTGSNREREAQTSMEVSYPWAGKPVFHFLFELFMHIFLKESHWTKKPNQNNKNKSRHVGPIESDFQGKPHVNLE